MQNRNNAENLINAIREIESSGFVRFDLEDRHESGCSKEDREKRRIKDIGYLKIISLYIDDSYEEICKQVAMGYNHSDNVRKMYLRKISSPDPLEAFIYLFNHYKSKI